MAIRTLVVDDSPTMRAILTAVLGKEDDIEVVGAAKDAMDARGMIRELDPDVITLDIEMPGMNGLDFLEKIMTLKPKPVIVVSGLTAKGADATMRALEIGAFDCYAKPEGFGGNPLAGDNGMLAQLIRLAARHGVKPVRSYVSPLPQGTEPMVAPRCLGQRRPPRVIAIGSSTGGVEALSRLLQDWPADCPPTLIVQHINGSFAEAMARRLDTLCKATVVPAESDTFLQPGHVYVAPGSDRHLVVRGTERLMARLIDQTPEMGHRPSVDILFKSVVDVVPGEATGILLTGMGEDGARGLLKMRHSRCCTIAQDEATSTVYGMPRAARDMGAADHILAIDKIAGAVFS
jgi:two-component system, chemotaxis family, protein-glutamate methylesterase/glutaminase